AAGMTVAAACAWAGLPRASFYRVTRGYRHYTPVTDPVPQRARRQPAALTSGERAQVCAVLEDEQYADLSVCQTYWRAFDTGRIPCSQSSFYRIAKAERMTGDRRRGRHGGGMPRPVPKAVATAPGQLWSWDVTELKGPGRQRFKLYLVIDVFSRYPVGWRIEHREDTTLAVDMFASAFTRYGAPQVLHADNGAIMRSHDLLDALHAANTAASFSRPRVSDDNPFSESLFKTIKYDLNCPDRFDHIDHARAWTADYLAGYAGKHRHSGLAWHTPESVFDGTAAHQQQHRQTLLNRRYLSHPQRFRRPPRAPEIPTIVGINHRRTTQPLSQTG
ncbi:putative transposase, partial [Gordonia namibiensis NBRC 108229]